MCLFCDIIEGKIPSTKVYEDDMTYCFNDINPVAPTHVLVVPKKHFDDIRDMAKSEEGEKYMYAVIKAIDKVAEINGLDSGFRVINNCGKDGGQTVLHAHYHVIGGVKLTEKMI
ncbi:MAG: histidine triad nucleotide-binding protein [Clostridiales bacterium]|nr:histidine triad nucleotide-binding protein [Clostridiales bacterium]HAW15899.1 histidine triad nucleotide-binding protein [Clostridiales bacterium]